MVRTTLRALLLAPVVVLLAQLCGLVYDPRLGGLEHSLFEQVLVVGWRIDEGLGALSVAGRLALVLGAAAAGAGLLGVIGPLEPAAGRGPGRRALELGRAPLGVAMAVGLSGSILFGIAVAPLTFLLVLGASAMERPSSLVSRERGLLAAVLGITGLSTVFVASMLATPREGTLYDHATGWLARTGAASWLVAALAAVPVVLALRDVQRRKRRGAILGGLAVVLLVVGGPAWAAVGAGTTAAMLLAGRAGLPVIPDLTQWPARWPWELGRVAAVAAAMTVGNGALDVLSCPDADVDGVRLAADARTAFDLDFDDRGHLAVVHREEGWLRVYEVDGATGPVTAKHEVVAREGDLEEVFGLPGGRGFLATEILQEEPKTLLLVVDPVSGEVREGRFAGMCWVSSVVWDPARGAVILGCETAPDLLAFDPESMELSPIGQLDVWDDSEDLALSEDGETLWAVSLAEGDSLRWVDPGTAGVRHKVVIGGFNYSVVHDAETARVLVARFHDSQVVAFDDETGDVEARVRTGFGVRPMVAVPGRRLLLTASMFQGSVALIDADELKVLDRLRLGGRVKALAVDEVGKRAWLSSTCGTFELDVEKLESAARR